MKLFIFSSGSYDMEQWAVVAEDLRKARELFKTYLSSGNDPEPEDTFEFYAKNVKVGEVGEIIKIQNGD